MPFACARALRVCALLVLPATAFAQSNKTPTIFSATSQLGTVTLRAAIVLENYTVKPLPLMRVVAVRTDGPEAVAAETDLDGRVSMSLRVGAYTLRAKTAQPVSGRSYAWAVRVIVRPQRTEQVQLTNSNASITDSAAMVAAAPSAPEPMAAQPTPPKPATQKPAQSAGATNKVVPTPASAAPAPVESPKQSASSPAPATHAAPAQAITPASPTPIQSTPATTSPASPVAATSNVAAPAPARRVQTPKLRRTNTSGVMLGLSFDASSIRSDDLNSSTESGPGVAGMLGWGFTKNFALVIDASGARISSLDGDYDLAHVDVGGRWHFVNRSALVPFVEVGYAGRAARKQDAILSDGNGNSYTGELSVLGTGVSAGGGFEYFPTPGLALGGSFKWTSGQFTQVRFDNVTIDGFKVDATSARFNMGFTWYPMRGGR